LGRNVALLVSGVATMAVLLATGWLVLAVASQKDHLREAQLGVARVEVSAVAPRRSPQGLLHGERATPYEFELNRDLRSDLASRTAELTKVWHTPSARAIAASSAAQNAAVVRLMKLIGEGRIPAAQKLDDKVVQPTGEKLGVQLTHADKQLRGELRSADDRVRMGTLAVVVTAGLVLLVVMLLAAAARRRRERAEIEERIVKDSEQRVQAMLRVQATHDPLTGLANRRKLAEDLAIAAREATVERPARLALFDLDGFKAYNDRFGHHGGDLLLTRLSHALMTAVGPDAGAYRLGGDEFCVVSRGDDSETVMQACRSALTTEGLGFVITSSYGVVLMPVDTNDPDVALRLADDRMYAHKNSGRASASQQTRDLALKVLAVNEPEVQAHSVNVATLVERVSRRLGIAGTELIDVVRAAELHDIGKIAIPFAVLHKPAPLDEEEWELMRSHATIGANILSAAPALARVAEIVRSTHERVDGAGYPHGLAGEQIPLPSRIVFVCDAFDAMISERPYGVELTTVEALAELRRNAGTQFDSAVVDAFCAELIHPATAGDSTSDTRTTAPRPIRA